MTALRVEYEPEEDAAYVELGPAVGGGGETVALDDVRYVDYGPDGTPLGVEFLCVSRGVELAGVPRAAEVAAALRRVGIHLLQPTT